MPKNTSTPLTKVSSLHIYPIKSTAGINLTNAEIGELGIAFDRRFVISNPSGQFITARTEPKLCLVRTQLLNDGLELSAPFMPTLTLLYKEFTSQYQRINVWEDNINGQLCSEKANAWFSDYLQRACTLLFFGDESYRERMPNTEDARKLAFADGYPLLLTSQASLNNLNQRLTAQHQQAVSMTQFRPNIVIENTLAFAEDTWQHIRIGAVDFKVGKPCERCVFTTVNPNTGEKHLQQQPLKTLRSFRQNQHGEVLFGQNLIALNNGIIKIGDQLSIISKQKPPIFTLATPNTNTLITTENDNNHIIDKAEKNLTNKPAKQKITVYFEKWHKKYQILAISPNTDLAESTQVKTLLEVGEEAGLILPYSCRAGMCGRCKAKLISGEVKQIPHDDFDGLTAMEKQQGYILCCSTIATSDVVIKHE